MRDTAVNTGRVVSLEGKASGIVRFDRFTGDGAEEIGSREAPTGSDPVDPA
ncbi:MAG: hypothetical protein QM690_12375 [Sphingobium sp.]